MHCLCASQYNFTGYVLDCIMSPSKDYTRKLGLGGATLKKFLIPFSTNQEKNFCLKIYYAIAE